MYAAGYYEGYSSWLEIWNAWNNFNNGGLNGAGTLPGEAQPFVTNQTNWALSMFQSNPNDPYWSLVNVTYSQVFGMYAGYIAQIGNNSQYYLTFDQFYFLTNMGDLEDIVPGFQNLSAVLNSCTGFIKLTEDDLISAHTTWNT